MSTTTGRSPANIHGKSVTDKSPNNPTTHSKAQRRYGTDGSKDAVHGSTGYAPSTPLPNQQRPSAPIVRENPHMTPHSEQVGFINGKHVAATHPLASARASGGGVQMDRAPTTGSRGQAWSAGTPKK